MRIDHTAFGEITIDCKTYKHEVIIRLEVVKRKEKTSDVISEDGAKFVFEKRH